MADKAASLRAREEGNTYFRKGRWRDAAAAYLRAAELDPQDAVAWSNRAMAWLKLENYPEARDDAAAALARDPANVKARYRRAAAYRALGDIKAARADLEDVLRREPGNTAARGELDEVEKLEKLEEGEMTAQREGNAEPKVKELAETTSGPTPSPPTKPGAGGFAALRQTRTRPSYAGREEPSPAEPSPPRGAAPVARVTPNIPESEAVPTPADTAAPRASPPPASPPPASATPPAPPPTLGPAPIPTNPRSTAPGAGLALLRALAPLPPPHRWSYLRHYAPDAVAQITAPVLEPDGLDVLLGALAAGLPYDEADAGWVRDTMDALRGTRRWRMNAAMLSRAERESGVRAWEAAGGDGPF